MTEETRRKAIEAMGGESAAIARVDALSDLMREIAMEEAYRQVEAHVNSANHVRQVTPPPAPGATEAMLHAMAVEKGTKSAASAPATLTLGCGICTRDAYHAACPQHGANRPGQGRSDPVVPATDKCEECGCGSGAHLARPAFGKPACSKAKCPPETMPEWPGPPGYYPEYVWLSGQTAYSDAPSSGTARPKYIRADVAAKEVAEAVAEAECRSIDNGNRCAKAIEHDESRPILGATATESLLAAARRVVAERDAAKRDVAEVKACHERTSEELTRVERYAIDYRNRADRAEARVKELEGMREGDEAELSVIIQQRDKLEQELTAANLAIESARKTLWTVKP